MDLQKVNISATRHAVIDLIRASERGGRDAQVGAQMLGVLNDVKARKYAWSLDEPVVRCFVGWAEPRGLLRTGFNVTLREGEK